MSGESSPSCWVPSEKIPPPFVTRGVTLTLPFTPPSQQRECQNTSHSLFPPIRKQNQLHAGGEAHKEVSINDESPLLICAGWERGHGSQSERKQEVIKQKSLNYVSQSFIKDVVVVGVDVQYVRDDVE